MDLMVEEFREIIANNKLEIIDESVLDIFKKSKEKTITFIKILKEMISKVNQKTIDNLIVALQKASGGEWENMSTDAKMKKIKDKKFLTTLARVYSNIQNSVIFSSLPATLTILTVYIINPKNFTIKNLFTKFLKYWFSNTVFFSTLGIASPIETTDNQIKYYIKDIEGYINKLKKFKVDKNSADIEKIMKGEKI